MFTFKDKLKFCANRIHHLLAGEDVSDEVEELLTLERGDGARITLCLLCFCQYERIIRRLGIEVVDKHVEPRSLLPLTSNTLRSCDNCLHHFLSFENLESVSLPKLFIILRSGVVTCLCEDCAAYLHKVLLHHH